MKGTIDRSTAKLVPADGKEVFFWDDTLTGFGLRAHAARDGSIKRAYFIQYKIGQQQRRYRIGDPLKIDAAAARKRAKELFAQVTLGVDPAAKEEEKKEKTFSQVIERYLTEKKVKPHSFHILKAYLTGTYFKPLHGKALTKIVRTDITACLTDIKAINGHGWTDIAVKATSSQGNVSAPKAARRIGSPVASVDTCASTQTISPDVLLSAVRIAAEMRSQSCSEMFITTSPTPRHHPTSRLRRKSHRG
jgi:hypothetical protein